MPQINFPERSLILKSVHEAECEAWVSALMAVHTSGREGRAGGTPTSTSRAQATNLKLSLLGVTGDDDSSDGLPSAGGLAGSAPQQPSLLLLTGPTTAAMNRSRTSFEEDEFAQAPSPRSLLANPQLAMRFMSYQAAKQAQADEQRQQQRSRDRSSSDDEGGDADFDSSDESSSSVTAGGGKPAADAQQKPSAAAHLRLEIPASGSAAGTSSKPPVAAATKLARAPSKQMDMLVLDPEDVYGSKQPPVSSAARPGGLAALGSTRTDSSILAPSGGSISGLHQRKASQASSGRRSITVDDILENWDTDDEYTMLAAAPGANNDGAAGAKPSSGVSSPGEAFRRHPGVTPDHNFVDSDWDSPVSASMPSPISIQPAKRLGVV